MTCLKHAATTASSLKRYKGFIHSGNIHVIILILWHLLIQTLNNIKLQSMKESDTSVISKGRYKYKDRDINKDDKTGESQEDILMLDSGTEGQVQCTCPSVPGIMDMDSEKVPRDKGSLIFETDIRDRDKDSLMLETNTRDRDSLMLETDTRNRDRASLMFEADARDRDRDS